MAERLSRRELYELVWSYPLVRLAERFGVSNVAVGKACTQMHVPLPGRGYWARLASGKRVLKTPLPPRPPGLDETVVIGGGRYWRYSQVRSDEEILAPLPDPPTFDEPIDAVQRRVEKSIGKISAIHTLDNPPPLVAKLLAKDEERRKRYLESSYRSSFDEPFYDSPGQQRRLRLLAGLLRAVARCGCRADIWGTPPYNAAPTEFAIRVNHQSVPIRVSAPDSPQKAQAQSGRPRSGVNIKIELYPAQGRNAAERTWQDSDKRLEQQLGEIAVAIVLAGETQHRDAVIRGYEWRVQSREEYIEKRRKEQEEAERKERERLAELERKRVERLLGEAEALRRARDIRHYVEQVRSLVTITDVGADALSVGRWAEWALSQADKIDPVKSGQFLANREGSLEEVPKRPSSDMALSEF